MRKAIIWILFISLIAVSFGATLTAFRFHAFTLDRSVTPQSVADVESVKVVIYRANGTTAIDSGYTDDLGIWSTKKLYQTNPTNRVLVSKTGYASEWTSYTISNIDTTADSTYCVPLRMRSNVGDSTYVLSFVLVNADGTPATGVTCQARVSAPYIGTGGGLLAPSTDYGISSDVTDAGGLCELNILSNSCFELWIAGTRRFASSVMDSTKNLGNIVLKP